MSEALLMLYVEAEAEAVPIGCRDYIIYLEDETSNPTADHAMEMPGFGHTFHLKCITKWFGWRSICLMC